MIYDIVISDQAEIDLRGIFEYIAFELQAPENASEKLKTTGDNISNAGQKLLPVTAAVTGMGAASLKTAADFESSMSQVQATMGITKDTMV